MTAHPKIGALSPADPVDPTSSRKVTQRDVVWVFGPLPTLCCFGCPRREQGHQSVPPRRQVHMTAGHSATVEFLAKDRIALALRFWLHPDNVTECVPQSGDSGRVGSGYRYLSKSVSHAGPNLRIATKPPLHWLRLEQSSHRHGHGVLGHGCRIGLRERRDARLSARPRATCGKHPVVREAVT
jgi:hypothetical protein